VGGDFQKKRQEGEKGGTHSTDPGEHPLYGGNVNGLGGGERSTDVHGLGVGEKGGLNLLPKLH